jgi:uncharacterized protein YhjY with autotransporter beta-barrel domain
VDIGSFYDCTRLGLRTRGLGSGPSAIVVATLLLSPTAALSAGSVVDDPDFVDNKFESYMLRPCIDGAVDLFLNQGWTLPEIEAYDAAICTVVFNQGNFNSGGGVEGYASTTNAGTVAAQSKTADSLAAQQIESVQGRLDEIKEEEEPSGGIGLLLSVQGGETERVSTNNEVGYDSDLEGFVGGLDYRFNDKLITGIAIGVTSDDAAFDGSDGFLETDSESLLLYTTYLISDNAYIDAYIGVASLEYSTEREGTIDGSLGDDFGLAGKVSADYDGDQTLVGVSTGYDWFRNRFAYGVSAALDYSKTEIDSYEEKGGTGLELAFPDQEFESLTLALGVNGSYTVDMGWGALIPNIRVAAVHEDMNDARSFDARLIVMPDVDTTSLTLETDSPDRDYILSTLGIVLAMNSGAQYFMTYENMSSHDFLETWSLSAGLLVEF